MELAWQESKLHPLKTPRYNSSVSEFKMTQSIAMYVWGGYTVVFDAYHHWKWKLEKRKQPKLSDRSWLQDSFWWDPGDKNRISWDLSGTGSVTLGGGGVWRWLKKMRECGCSVKDWQCMVKIKRLQNPVCVIVTFYYSLQVCCVHCWLLH